MGLNTSISALEMLISHTISTFHDVCVTNFDANMRFLTQNFTQKKTDFTQKSEQKWRVESLHISEQLREKKMQMIVSDKNIL